jgi:hypothetical protein
LCPVITIERFATIDFMLRLASAWRQRQGDGSQGLQFYKQIAPGQFRT